MTDKEKRALLLLSSYYPYEDANTNAAIPLIIALELNKYSVDILTCDYMNKLDKFERQNNVNVYRFNSIKLTSGDNVNGGLVQSIKHFVDSKMGVVGVIIIKKVNWLMRILERRDSNSLYCRLKELVKNNSYDLIVAITSPFEMQRCVLRLFKEGKISHNSTKYLAYFTDPWGSYIGNKMYSKRYMDEEIDVYKVADKIIVTPEMYAKDNLTNALKAYLEKTMPVELGCLHELSDISSTKFFDSTKINCLFCGSLQDSSVRDPRPFLKFISECDDENIVFHLVINNLSKEISELLDNIDNKNHPNIHIYDRKPMDVCNSMMCQADVCINIGNLCDNQLPSKIFDYMGSKSSIVNFYSIEGDTAKVVLEVYPNILNISCGLFADILEEKEAFKKFCYLSKENKVEWSEIAKLYDRYSRDSVASKLCKIVSQL